MNEIRVKVVAQGDRSHFMLCYRCPDTGRRKYKSSGVERSARKRDRDAAAHDLRRSFGERWATRGMPVVLQKLMRHESIETTLKFYVGQNADRTADVLWAAHEHVYSSDYSAPTSSDGAKENPAATLGHSGT